eukprot:CAMPEP_0173184240 /NCGR_PEP_ID=MMETSP1141-20130122/8852_1 /TAXON_ID=483371 /ORGANISM="non described non described, Strain CCMP2298" /LENGTH=247 /DNA_ID=CAMNT_0014107561 /DNA_START=43 /DNA_END=783 /DNA_ORIENTATION=-
MKFVALLSGGKDSCYNVVKCTQHGHTLVCLANLHPPDDFVGEEMDSFMYQSAAHSTIPVLAECFGVPLIRQPITGGAVNQALDYLHPQPADEVEDLFYLLQRVKEAYPDCQGVSCGAILSTYQRLRVEHVCARLQMTVLSYLWMRNRRSLLTEMVRGGGGGQGQGQDQGQSMGGQGCGVDAVLVKVAGAGLVPHKHLGHSLSHLYPQLLHLHRRFGLDLCGEGGEYETLVLDCAAFMRRLVLGTSEV